MLFAVGWWFRSGPYRVDTSNFAETDKYVDFVFCGLIWDGSTGSVAWYSTRSYGRLVVKKLIFWKKRYA